MKSKKRALYTSVVSLFLCVAMLIGTTFAWFTDTATSGVNKILAGNLDVDLVMDKEENGTYVSIAEEDAAIFGGEGSQLAQNNNADTLWEPGKTQIVYLGVKNNGTLALKYNIILTVEGDLAPALEYAIVDGANAESLSAVTNWDAVKSASGAQTGDVAEGNFTAAQNGALERGETDYFALAVHMKETAGNEYQKDDITIDVVVKATQEDSETDSFDNTYDKLASYNTDDEQSKYTHTDCLTFYSDSEFTLEASLGFTPTETSCLQYSTDYSNWENKWDGGAVTATQNGDKYFVYLRGTHLTTLAAFYEAEEDDDELKPTTLVLTPKDGLNADENPYDANEMIDCCGNIMTLLDYDHPEEVQMGAFAFACLFATGSNEDPDAVGSPLRTVPELPATTLASGCYGAMFLGCNSLTTAPALPAMTLADSCYASMFYDCTSLTTAPALPATTLANGCYSEMFYGCTALTTAPKSLPAETLADECYREMFHGCTALTTAPELYATKLADSCCEFMFDFCTSLHVSTTGNGSNKIFTCPSDIPDRAVSYMFDAIGDDPTGTPTAGTTYYYCTD